MPEIIIDNKGLNDIFNVVSWFDKIRWTDSTDVINYSKELTNSEKILTHWLCYITDRQMDYRKVWNDGGFVFSELVFNYSKKNTSSQEILTKHYESYTNKNGKRRYRFKASNRVFPSRYVTDDYQNIKQTLEVLNHKKFNRSLIDFIIYHLEKFSDKEDILSRIACALYILTYRLDKEKSNSEKAIQTLSDPIEFEKELSDFKKYSTAGKKRLWCCIRDYKKGEYNRIFKNAIKDKSKDYHRLNTKWDALPMSDLELPGDVWNNRPVFKENLMSNVVNLKKTKKTWEMPKIIRKIYLEMNEPNEFYPEQFDITFDFVPRMCETKLCDVCPFGKNGSESICISDKSKNCPVALVCCGYIYRCIGRKGDCSIRNGIGKRICSCQ